MKSSLSAPSGPRVRIRDVPRIRSGSRGKFLLRAERANFKGPQAALALAKRRLPLRAAHGVVASLYDRGLAVVELPAVENARNVIRDLAGAGVIATPYGAPEKIDIKTIREVMGLSQDEFALEFGLEVSTLRNWEQGRSAPDTAARNFLITVARNPEAVRAALSKTDAKDDYAAKRLAMKGSVAGDPVTLDEPLKKSLGPYLDDIKAAFVYGSVAKRADTAKSDIDVMVIGDELDLVGLYAALQSAESALRRKISPIFLSFKEWRRRQSEKGSFANKISKRPKFFIIGSERELRG